MTKGRVWNVTGDCLSEDASQFEVTERWPIHRSAPKIDALESKVRDLLGELIALRTRHDDANRTR